MVKDFLGIGISKDLEWLKYEEAISESIKVILSTRRGERVMRPDFGCGINDMVFATLDSATINTLKYNVRQSLRRWEPRIKVSDVLVTRGREEDEGDLLIDIQYTVIETNNSKNLVYPFYVSGAEA